MTKEEYKIYRLKCKIHHLKDEMLKTQNKIDELINQNLNGHWWRPQSVPPEVFKEDANKGLYRKT